MISFPFESKNLGSVERPNWDRAITAEMERTLNQQCWTNGVFIVPATSLLVEATNGMKIKVNPGGCHILGARAFEPNARYFTLQPASSLPRIDRVVIRFDVSEDKRNIDIYIKQGGPATYPTPPELIQESNYYEMALANIRIEANTSEVSNIHITDLRLNPDLCGIVVPAIPHQQETEQLWLQIKESIDVVESALSKTTAGNLKTLINNNKGEITSIKNNINISEETKTKFKKLGWRE